MEFINLIFYACLRLRFLDVETNPGPRSPVPAICRILCSNVRGLTHEAHEAQICLMCRSCWFPAFRQPKFECGCCEILVFGVCGVRQNIYVYSLYRNPDLDDRIFDGY